MATGVRLTIAASVLGMSMLGSTGTVRADVYDFAYQSLTGVDFTLSGNFSTLDTIINEGRSIFNYQGNIGEFSIDQNNSRFNALSGVLGLRFNNYASLGPHISNFVGYLNESSNGIYVGKVKTSVEVDNENINSSGIFIAMLVDIATPSAPSHGGSSPSGSAPSPEVNTLLGFLIVGGTVAVLKRKRKDHHTEGA